MVLITPGKSSDKKYWDNLKSWEVNFLTGKKTFVFGNFAS